MQYLKGGKDQLSSRSQGRLFPPSTFRFIELPALLEGDVSSREPNPQDNSIVKQLQ